MTRNKPTTTDIIIGTALGAGYWPWGPGTAGAVAGMLVWIVIAHFVTDHNLLLGITAAISTVATIVSIAPINRLEKYWGEDPSRVVIDEVVGVWIALLAVPETREWYFVLLALVLFRFMDITKPLGCRWLDRNIHGGWGVMLDDILAGTYAALVLWAMTLI